MKNKNAQIPSMLATQARNICYVAGRSGGHIIPALTHARTHKAQYPQAHVLFIATTSALDKNILNNVSYVDTTLHVDLDTIPTSYLKRAIYLVYCCKAFIQSVYALKKHKIAAVVSTGGYVSLPVCFAAYVLRISIQLYELNVKPGRATLLLARYAKNINVCFKTALPYFSQRGTYVEYPLRYTHIPTDAQRAIYQNKYSLASCKKTILILGGSQGSLFLNKSIASWLESTQSAWSSLQVIHQTGSHDRFDWQDWYASRGITAVVFDFMEDIAGFYACADVIVCRAGAGTLFEIAFFKKRCIIIPLITAQTAHQVDNALYMVAEYPNLFTMLYQDDIEKDSTILAQALASELHLEDVTK